MSLSGLQIGFNRPEYLVLLVLLPILWIWSFRSLAGLGRIRRLVILGLTSSVVALIICALAEIQWQRINDRVTVIYLLDQSESIPTVQRQAMLRYVTTEVERHRDSQRRDRAGVIVFGRDPAIEIPPFDASIPNLGKLESLFEVRTDATNLAAALKMAQAMFAEDTAKRVVLVTDGNENVGDVKSVANALASSGVGIDVVPIQLSKGAEVAVERVALPTDARQGQPTEVRAVVSNYGKPTEANPTGEAKGVLRISRSHDGEESVLSEEDVTLTPGKNVFKIDTKLDKTGAYNYRAEFVPADGSSDFMKQNNIATGFTQVRGKGRVLLIENAEHPGDFNFLVERLQSMNLEVKKAPSSSAFTSLAELQGFDTVVMANVPRAGIGAGGEDLVGFTDEQVMMLVRNVEQMGCGLVMLGGEQSFGCGGWAGTELEKIMPVDFQIKNAKVKPNGALVLLMHASEMAQGNHWQKVVGRKAVQMLGPNDYCGVLHWDDFTGADNWLWKGGLSAIGNNQNKMLAAVDRMTPGDMPQFDPAMQKAYNAFQSVAGKAAVKHMIIISDGDPAPPSNALIAKFANSKPKITISTVAIGTHGPPGSTPLQSIANATGGKYYVVNNAAALPTIYIQEVSKVTKPLIYEHPEPGFQPQITYPHEMLQGIDDVPPLTGFVLTTKKEHPLVEVAIRSPVPDGGGENGTILASWQYKAGRTVVFTSDAGKRWAKAWPSWPNYDKFFSQIVRWSMRPVNVQGKFTVATDIKDGRVRVVVTALDQNDEFLNFLNMSGTATSPDPKKPAIEIGMRQEAPGRYVGEFAADEAGSYFIAVSPGKDYGGPLLAGVSVPYSSEFRERETNMALLEMLANIKPQGGEKGQVINADITSTNPEELTLVDTFRANLAKAISSQDAWPLAALLAACLFLINIAVRRISIDPEWFAPAWRYVRRLWSREAEQPPVEERLERLRSLKAQVSGQMDERRAATRFEPEPDAEVSTTSLEEAMRESVGSTGPSTTSSTPMATSGQPEEETYTDRLLKAKRRAQQNKPE
jgi:Mg-chelatase subunit ChlD/uncharacterized membrane protein